jgi:XTP/dITP diphosphohydrolase
MTLVLATRNAGKVREYRELLAGLPLCTRFLADYAGMPPIAEEAFSLEENAAAKAWAACRFSGSVALGEDTGLEVEALSGAPGVRAARYFGEGLTDRERVDRLLDALRGTPAPQRRACFRCVLVIAEPGGRQWAVSGECRGSIAMAPRGSGGFGYDPVFEVEGTGRTLAEFDPVAKNAVSHRGRATAAARPILERLAVERGWSSSQTDLGGRFSR